MREFLSLNNLETKFVNNKGRENNVAGMMG